LGAFKELMNLAALQIDGAEDGIVAFVGHGQVYRPGQYSLDGSVRSELKNFLPRPIDFLDAHLSIAGIERESAIVFFADVNAALITWQSFRIVVAEFFHAHTLD